MSATLPRARSASTDLVLSLADPRATEPTRTGAKAARLAAAAVAGLPTLPGFVVTTAASDREADGLALADGVAGHLRGSWAELSQDGRRPLVVRSSSVVEDDVSSSMAGRFLSVLDVVGWEAFLDAVGRVLASATVDDTAPQPMAVLVQPMLDVSVGGVLFGIDPVTGDHHRLVVEAVAGSPEALVSGRVTASRYVLDRRGRQVDADAPDALLDGAHRRALARLHRQAQKAFDGPQDIEWAWDRAGRLTLLQSRPVTASGPAGAVVGPVLGPGPVGETLPDVLSPLEADLWVEPMRRGIALALRAVGAASDAQLDASPVVTTVHGRVVADLELLGVQEPHPSPLARLDPRGPARHLAVAWRVGRLRAALPATVDDLLEEADADLAGVPALDVLTTPQLVGLVGRARMLLAALHGHEVLTGMLLTEREAGTGAGHAVGLLARERADGADDDTIVARHPAVLALVPPRLGGRAPLPPVTPGHEHVRPAVLSRREALRLRARWVQELTARAADELGRRFETHGILSRAGDVGLLRLPEVVAVADGRAAPPDLAERARRDASPPLPAAFWRTVTGEVVAAPSRHTRREGRGAGGGRGSGPVRHVDDVAHLARGDVLVVRTLEPHLAAVLPGLGGLVAETGSTLSHLAILAREMHVPTVVAVPDALARFPVGRVVVVDGTTGAVTPTEEVTR